MPTLKELMGDLKRGDGRKFSRKCWGPKEYFEPIFSDKDGDWFGLDSFGYQNSYCADDVHDWEPYIELKAKQKVKLYSPIVKSQQGYIYLYGKYADKKELYSAGGDTIICWHEIEVEVDL